MRRHCSTALCPLVALVFGAGVIISLGLYLFSYDGNLLLYCVFGSLMTAQLVEYGMQIVLYRTTV